MDALNENRQKETSSPTVNIYPTFEPWKNYDPEQLAAIVRGWKFILNQPGWQQWHEYGQRCMDEIQAELERRKD